MTDSNDSLFCKTFFQKFQEGSFALQMVRAHVIDMQKEIPKLESSINFVTNNRVISLNMAGYLQSQKNNLFIFRGIVRSMHLEDEERVNDKKWNEFGVLGDVLLELQREEMEETETCQVETRETSIKQNTVEILAEINATLKEIAETQKRILEEIEKNKAE